MVLDKTKTWIDKFIVAKNICPFAKNSLDDGSFKLVLCEQMNEKKALDDFIVIYDELVKTESLTNSFIVFPNLSNNYLEFYDFVDLCQSICSSEIQLICFHPNFYFENTDPKDLANYVNRSPYPSIHLLKESEITKVLKNKEADFGEKISKINEALLNNLPDEELDEIFS